VRRYTIPEPGAYVFRIRGLGPRQERDEKHTIVFATPYGPLLLAGILGIVFGACLFNASLVLLLLRLLVK
jgi:hypothetical protein